MKIVHPELQNKLIFDSYNECELIIESQVLFSKFVSEMHMQITGKEGKFVLSDNEKELEIDKVMEMIVNPFSINLNDKKILGKLYSELSTLAMQEDMYMNTIELFNKIRSFITDIEQKSSYILETDSDFNIVNLFKAFGVQIESCNQNFFETVCQYMKVISQILCKKIFAFVNLRSYITDEQAELLIKEAYYNEVNVLFIGNVQRSCLNGCRQYIIDSDYCEI